MKLENINEAGKLLKSMRFDSYGSEHYNDFAKLNRYILSLLATAYSTKNNYQTFDLFSQEQLSDEIKTTYFEAENYNIKRKSEITGNTDEPATSRFEIRTIGRGWAEINDNSDFSTQWNYESIEKEFSEHWVYRLERCMLYTEECAEKYNTELERLYKEDATALPKQYPNVPAFIARYQNCIFTRKQLIDLLARIGVKNPEQYAKYYKSHYGIEFFSKKDLKYAIDEIKRSIFSYFSK